MKKLALLAGIAVLAFALAACGGGGAAGGDAAVNEAAAGDQTGAVAGNTVTDTMLSQDAANVKSITIYDATANTVELKEGDAKVSALAQALSAVQPQLLTDVSNINSGANQFMVEVNFSDDTVDYLFVLNDGGQIVRFVNDDTNAVSGQSSEAVGLLQSAFGQ